MIKHKHLLFKYFLFKLLGHYSSFKKTIVFLIINHWLMVFCIFILLLFYFQLDEWKIPTIKIRLILESIEKIFWILLSLNIFFKLFIPIFLYHQVVNITNKFKTIIWLEYLFNPFGLIFSLFKLCTSNVYSQTRKQPLETIYCFNKKKQFHCNNNKNLLTINNLNFVYHNNEGINKISHYFLKKINHNWYENHMKKENYIQERESYFHDFSILKNINLSINANKFIAILGSNGSGKSTLIKIINHLISGYQGQVLWFGKNLKNISIKSFAQNVSYVPQHSIIYNNISVYDFVEHGLFPHEKLFHTQRQMNEQKINNILQKFNLLEIKNKLLSELSGGQKQKVIIARALAQNTSVLIMDEPINYLDIKNQYLILDLLKQAQLENQMTIITILHNIEITKKFADEVILIDGGIIVNYGKINQILNEQNINNIFGKIEK